MNTPPIANHQAINSLRARTADFFRMDVSRGVSKSLARDSNPLRRSLNKLQDMDLSVSNEHMCTAMWQLMQRC